jgi:hypothetical protein
MWLSIIKHIVFCYKCVYIMLKWREIAWIFEAIIIIIKEVTTSYSNGRFNLFGCIKLNEMGILKIQYKKKLFSFITIFEVIIQYYLLLLLLLPSIKKSY